VAECLSFWRGHNIRILLQRRIGDVRVHEQETILTVRGLALVTGRATSTVTPAGTNSRGGDHKEMG